jgi:arginase family enzyme
MSGSRSLPPELGPPYPDTPGILTFLGAPEGDVEHLEDGMVAVAGVSYDLSTTGRIGARFAPRAYRETSQYYASAFAQDEMVEIITGDRMRRARRLRLLDLGDLTVYPLEWARTEVALREAIAKIVGRGALPIILGGDQLVTAPLVQGFAAAVRERTGRGAGYIQFSSQLDLGEVDPTWGAVWRGTAARRILDSGAVEPRNMAWIGTNGYLRLEDWEFAKKNELAVFSLEAVRRDGIVEVVERAVETAGEGCAAIWVSIDFDVLDGGYVAMQSAPRFDGLTNTDLLRAMDVLRRTKTGALGLVGLTPTVTMHSVAGQRFGVWLVIRFLANSVLASP